MTKKTIRAIGRGGFFAVLAFCLAAPAGQSALAASAPQAQTQTATNIQNTAATLQGNLYDPGGVGSATVWFQWGTTSAYGSETPQVTQNYAGTFSQTVSNLAPNATYHFRAVAQNQYGASYGQDMTFYTGSGGPNGQIGVSAGPDIYINQGQSAVLQGAGYDMQGNPVTYSWSCTGGSLSSSNVARPTYTPPYPYYGNQNTYVCTLTVSNAYGASSSDSTTVYVNYANGGTGAASFSVQTNPATDTFGSQATLNGYVSGGGYASYGWFQWGADTNYQYTTDRQPINYSGSFSQNIANLSGGVTYHFRAAAQTGNGATIYGPDMTFVANGTGSPGYPHPPNYGGASLQVQKQVIDLSSGNLNWQPSVAAAPNDIVEFRVQVQNIGGQDATGVMVRDQLPAGLAFRNSVTVNGIAGYSGGDIGQGIALGTIPPGQTTVVTYQAQVLGASYGATLANSATATSAEGDLQSAGAWVVVQSLVGSATYVSTGVGNNNLLTDTFFLPLLGMIAIIIAGYYAFRPSKKRAAKV